MLLRTRITLIVFTGFALLTLVLGTAAWLLDTVTGRQATDEAVSGQRILWGEIVAVQREINAAIADDLAEALAGGEATVDTTPADPGRLLALALDRSRTGIRPDAVQLIGARGGVLSGHGPATAQALLDAASLDRVLRGETVSGLRQIAAGRIHVLVARRILLPGSAPAALVVGTDARQALLRFAERSGSAATLLTLRGRTAAATDPALWTAAAVTLSPRRALAEQVAIDSRRFALVSVPLTDLGGGALGALVSLRDSTERAAALWRIRIGAIGTVGLLILAGCLGVFFYLRRSFRPLEHALADLHALSSGDAVTGGDHRDRRHDEIAAISEAVAAYRVNTHTLARVRRQRERVRLRQESVIRRQLQTLADALDPTDREEVLALLGPEGTRTHGDLPDDQLRRLAQVMGDLVRRIEEQHKRLSAMVQELREALVTKTKLAGIQQELEIARQVQLAILPRALPSDPRVTVYGQMTAAKEVGGDFYDYFMIDDHTLGFVIADVSGKGVPAALFMAISRTLLKSTALFERSPSKSIRRLNDLLAAENEQMMFVTVFYGVLDLDNGQLAYVNAGHNPPYHLTHDGTVQALPGVGGMAVAVMEDIPYQEQRMTLAPGDMLFLFTDGVTEAFDIDEVAYGEERLEQVLAERETGWSVHELSDQVIASVHRFERGAPQADDITCLTLRFSGT